MTQGSPAARAGGRTFATLLRYFHTLRFLRWEQLAGRVVFRLRRPTPDLRPAPARRMWHGPWVAPAQREPGLCGPREFEFLGLRGSLDAIGWQGPQRETLWRYNQHYFHYLESGDGADLVRDWIRANPPAGGVGWEPYPTSLRIVNWIKWAQAGGALEPEAIASLAVQTRWLAARLERHLLGNHLFANAKALLFAGRFFSGAEADEWSALGAAILAREIPEQILPDGAHFELTPMYHLLAVEDVLDLLNLLRASAADAAVSPGFAAIAGELSSRVPAMLDWMHGMLHPDGEISFFNDAAFGIAPTAAALDGYAQRLGFSARQLPPAAARWFEASGYARLEAGPAVALVDLAAVGPDYLPGHAHADTLSFELSVHGHRVVVNSGTSVYGTSAERLRQRGTAAHSTVVIDGEDSSEVWSGFRVARRARVEGACVDTTPDGAVARGRHTGYDRLPGRPRHQRELLLSADALRVEDRVEPTGPLCAVARFHLHPAASVRPDSVDSTTGSVALPNGHSLRWEVRCGAAVRVEPSTWHPRFGASITSRCLVVELLEGKACVEWRWTSTAVGDH